MKFKIKSLIDKTIIQVFISKNEELGERELSIISSSNERNLLKPILRKKYLAYKYLIEYNCVNCIPLTLYLKKQTVSKQDFYYILSQIIYIFNYLQISNMSFKNLILDFKHIFINANTNEIFFIYIPILSNNISVDMLGFFKDLLHSINHIKNENTKYLDEFSDFIRMQSSFSVSDFIDYICNHDKNSSLRFKYLMNQGNVKSNNNSYSNQFSFSSRDTIKEETTLLPDYLLNTNEPPGETTVLSENISGEETTVLSQNFHQNKYPYLIRLATKEKISIDKPIFVLGKEEQVVDCVISNNGAISRRHLDLTTQNHHYFITDLNSTNHTYVNGSKIPENIQIEVFDGDILKLADEEFEFHIT